MIEVNVQEIKTKIEKLQKLIDEYELTKLNLFNQLKNSCVSWQDGNSAIFSNSVNSDSNETDLVLQSIKSQKNVFEKIYKKYEEIGKTVKCNLNSKQSIMSAIDSIISQVNGILSEINKIDTSFYYPEASRIISQKNKLNKVKVTLNEIRTSISSLYSKVESIEKEIQSDINLLEQIKINDFQMIGEV